MQGKAGRQQAFKDGPRVPARRPAVGRRTRPPGPGRKRRNIKPFSAKFVNIQFYATTVNIFTDNKISLKKLKIQGKKQKQKLWTAPKTLPFKYVPDIWEKLA